jgi:hypothetical protein
MGSRVKRSPIGYVVPGMSRRFIPKYGSSYTPFSTSAPTTVFGTRMRCQPLVSRPGREVVSPPPVTSADERSVQPVERRSRSLAALSGDARLSQVTASRTTASMELS